MALKFLALLLPGRAFPLPSNLHWRFFLPGDPRLHDQDKRILRLEETAHGEVLRHLFFIDKTVQPGGGRLEPKGNRKESREARRRPETQRGAGKAGAGQADGPGRGEKEK